MTVPPGRLVERFYNEVWNRGDEAVARDILHPHFRLRASLGPELQGHDAFIAYMRTIRAALEGYRCTVDDVITTASRAAVRVRFGGIHRGTLFGVPPTGRSVVWGGAAFFSASGGRISALWVLADIDALKRQIGASTEAMFDAG